MEAESKNLASGVTWITKPDPACGYKNRLKAEQSLNSGSGFIIIRCPKHKIYSNAHHNDKA
ncbi:MAG: hypothetical protein ACETWK_07520 [Candidatus Aminicenantaceae bacterium]